MPRVAIDPQAQTLPIINSNLCIGEAYAGKKNVTRINITVQLEYQSCITNGAGMCRNAAATRSSQQLNCYLLEIIPYEQCILVAGPKKTGLPSGTDRCAINQAPFCNPSLHNRGLIGVPIDW